MKTLKIYIKGIFIILYKVFLFSLLFLYVHFGHWVALTVWIVWDIPLTTGGKKSKVARQIYYYICDSIESK